MSSNTISNTCANCGKGKESSINLKSCAACKMVKYCSRECQIAHRPQHKKECKKRAKELHDELLFKQPPQLDEDCPICFLRMPSINLVHMYMACCGKVICSGCVHANRRLTAVKSGEGASLCPFCRAPTPTSEKKVIELYKKHMELNDIVAIRSMGCFYANGQYGLPQSQAKALELWHRAGELGDAISYYNVGCAYAKGNGLERDKKKAIHYFELAAMRGSVRARNNLGVFEFQSDNFDRALKHYMIAIKGGNKKSLESIKQLYKVGHATKDEYTNALRAYQTYLDEVKSQQRDEAAAYEPKWTYY